MRNTQPATRPARAHVLDPLDRSAAHVGAEALVRWRHPEKGVIPPYQFIPLAEETGFIEELGEWILETACRQCKLWHDQGYTEFIVAVNLSARQFLFSDI